MPFEMSTLPSKNQNHFQEFASFYTLVYMFLEQIPSKEIIDLEDVPVKTVINTVNFPPKRAREIT